MTPEDDMPQETVADILAALYRNLLSNQEYLGAEFEDAMYSDLEGLYEIDPPQHSGEGE